VCLGAILVPAPTGIDRPVLPAGGRWAAVGLALMAVVLLETSASGHPLGLPTAVAGLATCALVLIVKRESPVPLITDVSWGVLPLVAGLFVLVDAVGRTGVLATLSHALSQAACASVPGAPCSNPWLITRATV
jgi:arsenical pump membrane protein